MAMRRLNVIGIGAGDPEYLTVQAIKALKRTDVFFFTDKGEEKSELLRLRNEICGALTRNVVGTGSSRCRILHTMRRRPLYGEAVREWHENRVDLWEKTVESELGRWAGRRVSCLGRSRILRQHVEDFRGNSRPGARSISSSTSSRASAPFRHSLLDTESPSPRSAGR